MIYTKSYDNWEKMKFRIYYEVLEQSFLFRDLLKKLYSDAEVELVNAKISSTKKFTVAKNLYPSMCLKDFDAIVSYFDNKSEEIPLFTVEFSNSIPTRDHILQRADGLMASAQNKIPHLKIMSLSSSGSEAFGKNSSLTSNFDQRESYKAVWNEFKLPILVIKTNLTAENSLGETFAKRLSRYKSIPEFNLDLLEELIKECVDGINEGLLPSDKIEGSLSKINSKLYEEIRKNTIKLSPFDGASSNRTWIENEDLFYRIYRYGHGMDPARGELNFYKLRWGKPLIGVMDPNDASHPINRENALKDFERNILGRKLIDEDFDGDIIKLHKGNIPGNLNKNGLAIFNNCKELRILNKTSGETLVKVEILIEESLIPDFTNITTDLETIVTKPKTTTEDIVTFSTIHGFLNENKIEIHHTSFPGDQGELAMIPISQGRRSKRTYIDIVAIKENKLFLIESKGNTRTGSLSPTKVKEDIEKLIQFKDDHEDYLLERVNDSKYLSENIFNNQDIDFEEVFLGVAFPKFSLTKSLINIDIGQFSELDFAVRIDNGIWEVEQNNTRISELTATEGFLDLPDYKEILFN
tara:strand:- start:2098 stop:3840 length:1743 start_codon:yes stop_codon:yes gene_type:complete